MRHLPLVGILLFIVVAFGWRPWLQYRRHGTSGILLFRDRRRSQIVRDTATIVWFAMLVGQAILVAAVPSWLPARTLGSGRTSDILEVLGAVLMPGGLLLMVEAQLDLGASWRIGIDQDARPGLVTGGIYGWSRNPIYLAFLIILTGYALLVPTVLSLAMLIGTYIGVRQQIAAEEKYLGRTYGAAYLDYTRRVGRLLPGIGRQR